MRPGSFAPAHAGRPQASHAVVSAAPYQVVSHDGTQSHTVDSSFSEESPLPPAAVFAARTTHTQMEVETDSAFATLQSQTREEVSYAPPPVFSGTVHPTPVEQTPGSFGESNVHVQQLQQQLNVALVSTDPAVVAQAWAAIDAARTETAQVRQEAQAYVHAVELNATQAVANANSQAQSAAAATRAEATQYVEEVERQASTAVNLARTQASQAEASALAGASATAELSQHNASLTNTVAVQAQEIDHLRALLAQQPSQQQLGEQNATDFPTSAEQSSPSGPLGTHGSPVPPLHYMLSLSQSTGGWP